MKRPLVILASVVVVSGLHAAATHAAATYPVKPITFVVPIEAGSDGDLLARPLVEKAAAIVGKPIIVENKPGAGNSIGHGLVLRAVGALGFGFGRRGLVGGLVGRLVGHDNLLSQVVTGRCPVLK